jgi:hypothetical protein
VSQGGLGVAARCTASIGIASVAILLGAAGCGEDEPETATEPQTQQPSDEFLKRADELCTEFAADLESAGSGPEAADAIDDFVGIANDFAVADGGSAFLADLSRVGAVLADDLDDEQGDLSSDQRDRIYSRVTTAAEQAGITCPAPDG